jgi:hypothetical protein
MSAKRTDNSRRGDESSKKGRRKSPTSDATTDTASLRTLRIERAYGGAVVFETSSGDVDAITTYFAFVTSWFAERGIQLPLIDDGTEGPRALAAASGYDALRAGHASVGAAQSPAADRRRHVSDNAGDRAAQREHVCYCATG